MDPAVLRGEPSALDRTYDLHVPLELGLARYDEATVGLDASVGLDAEIPRQGSEPDPGPARHMGFGHRLRIRTLLL
jgi:hypothetical protein